MVASYSSICEWCICSCRDERERYSKTSERGVGICEENSEIYRNTSTVDYPARTEANHQMLAGVFIRGSRINEIGGHKC